MESENKKNLISAGFMILLALFVIYLTMTQFVTEQAVGGGPFANSAFYPQVIAGVVILLSVFLAGSTLIKKRRASKPPPVPEGVSLPEADEEVAREELKDKPSMLKILLVAGELVVYTVLVEILGYWLTTPIFMAVLFRLLNVKSWIGTILLAIATSAVLYLFFSEILEVVLPYGRLGLFG